jgi:hypothetical protein
MKIYILRIGIKIKTNLSLSIYVALGKGIFFICIVIQTALIGGHRLRVFEKRVLRIF